MSKCVLLGLSLSILIKTSKLDNMLNQFKTEIGDFRQNAPKAWLGYIRIFLFKQFDIKTYINTKNVGNILPKMMYNSKTLALFNSKTILDRSTMCSTKVKRENCTVSKRPTGKFIWYDKTSVVFTPWLCPYQLPHQCLFTYWELHTKLRLNLTFFHIYFYTKARDMKGYTNHFTIIHGLDFHCDTKSTDTTKKRHQDLYFLFVLLYPTFTFYTTHNQVTVCLQYGSCDFYTGYHVEGMFAILIQVS